MNSGARAMLILPVLAIGLTACSTPDPTPAGATSLAVYPQPDHGMDALLEGTLLEVDGCVVVEVSDDSLVVPVFPEGDASWDDSELTWSGDAFASGSTIRLGGGFAESDEAVIPEGCGDHPTFLVSP